MVSTSTDRGSYGTTFVARYAGTCGACGARIKSGASVHYRYPGKVLEHVRCQARVDPAPTEAPAVSDANTIRLHGGSGYGCQGWQAGQVILSGEKRRRDGGPDGLVVLRASREYVREDGLSFGVGDDDGYLFEAECRPATAEELAPLVDDLCARAYRDAAGEKLSALVAEIQNTGERPEKSTEWPQGETLYDTATGYGHGSALVIAADSIWAIRRNGADGDDWSCNNIPGAIGCRVPRTEELAARLRELVGKAGRAGRGGGR